MITPAQCRAARARFAFWFSRQAAAGMNAGWYYRDLSDLYNEPVGPWATRYEAERASERDNSSPV